MASDSLSPQRGLLRSVALAFCAVVVFLYAGLIGSGLWTLDEYAHFSERQLSSWSVFLHSRLLRSPRPISEFVYFIYGSVVEHFHAPLITPFLGILWAVFLFCGLFTFLQKRRAGTRRSEGLAHLLIALVLMALFLVSGQSFEVFYWPAGAVAYLLTLSATLLLFLQIADGRLHIRAGRLCAGLCLLLAAASSEVGAFFVLTYALLPLLRRLIAALRKHKGDGIGPVLWRAGPGIVAAAVILVVRLNRYYEAELPGLASYPTQGHVMASLQVALKTLILETVGARATAHGSIHVGYRIPSEILLVLGVALLVLVYRRDKEVAGQLLEFSAALMFAAFLTVLAAAWHFGIICCDRHELMRRCWILMSLAGFALAAASYIPPAVARRCRRLSAWAPLLLIFAVLSTWHIRPLLRSYQLYGTLRRINQQNFDAGFRPGDGSMTYLLLPSGGLMYVPIFPPGTYMRGSREFAYPYPMLWFFGKSEMIVRPYNERLPVAEANR